MTSPAAQQDQIEPVEFGSHEQQAQQQQQQQAQAQIMAFLHDTAQQQPAPQQQQLHQFPPSIHHQLEPPVNMRTAHTAAFPPLMQHPPIHIPTRRDDENPNVCPPGMISIATHEHEIKMLRASHEETVDRLNAEITDLKRRVKIAKDNEKETKNKLQDELKEVHKNRSKRQRIDNIPHNKHGIKWRERYEELKSFVEVHGHTNVSKKEEQYHNLWHWCQTQRTGYANLIKGNETNLSSDRIKLLNELNFQWVRNKTPALKWDERFEQLRQFRKKHGHTRIPQKLNEPKGLGNWVLEQRRRYREKDLSPSQRKSKKGPLTDEQIEKLRSIDFEWSLRNRGSGTSLEAANTTHDDTQPTGDGNMVQL